MQKGKSIIISATVCLIISDALITIISVVLSAPSINFNLICGSKTLVCLLFVFIFSFFWHQDINVKTINKTSFITSLLLLLVHISAITISGIFSDRLASYALGLHPPILLASWFYVQRLQNTTALGAPVNPLQVQVEEALAPKNFDIKELMAVTNNFNNIVATGGFATVFKGMLPNSMLVSVLRLNSPKDHDASCALANDFSNATNSSHDNIMKLVGYCLTSDFVYFVQEYMENHRVSDWIFSKDIGRRRTLTIARRYQVAVDIAKVLDYLNKHRRNSHLNANSGSILLDGNFRAKVVNSSLRILLVKQKKPIYDGMSSKFNFYSYGLLLSELITGQRHQHCKLKQGKSVMEIVDQDLEIYDGDQQKLEKLLNVALLCLHQILENRPSTVQVVAMLEGQEPIPLVKETPSPAPNFEVTSVANYFSSLYDDDYFVRH